MSNIRIQVVSPVGVKGDLGPNVGLEDFNKRLGEFGNSLSDMASTLRTHLDKAAGRGVDQSEWCLAEAELKFSLELQAEAGVIITRASSKAAFEVSLKWARPGNH